MIRYVSDDQLRRLDQPALLLLGGASIVHHPGKVLARARALMPEVWAEVIDGAPHPLAETHADIVNERMLAFLGQTPPS